MSLDLKSPADHNLDGLSSQALKDHLAALIRSYVRQRSRDLADAVVRYLEALWQHPDYDGDPVQRCAYHRLAKHWRWLSQDLSRTAAH